jgi:hypothetical protein
MTLLVEHDLLVHEMGNQTYIPTEKDKRLIETMQQKARIDINGSLPVFRKQKYVSENMPFKNPVVELNIQLDHLFYNIVMQQEV